MRITESGSVSGTVVGLGGARTARTGGRVEGHGGRGGGCAGARLSMMPHDSEWVNYDSFEVEIWIYK